MYWSHFDRGTNLRLVRDAGFAIVWDRLVQEPEEFGYGELVFAAGPDGERFAMMGPSSEDWNDHSWSQGMD